MAPFLSLCQDECPLVTGAFIALQRDVRSAGLGNRVVFMEVSVDPGRDTPARLAAYSKEFGADWVLLTGTPADLHALWKFFGHPAVAFVLYAVLIPLAHLTSWYNLTLEHESVHNAEHLAFLVVGYLFWRQIFGSDPNAYRLHPALQFFYLFLAIPIDTFSGLSLAGESHEIFPAYFATHRTWGPSYVNDLHIGGSIMWVVGDTLMLWPMIPVALRWMHREERKAARIDRELDAQAAAAANGTQPPRSINSTRTPSGSVQ